MSNLTFSSPDLASFCQLNNFGLVATGQQLCAERAVIECRFTKAPEPCPRCGAVGASRGTVKAFPWGDTLGIGSHRAGWLVSIPHCEPSGCCVAHRRNMSTSFEPVL